jgi:hypothetical protein
VRTPRSLQEGGTKKINRTLGSHCGTSAHPDSIRNGFNTAVNTKKIAL